MHLHYTKDVEPQANQLCPFKTSVSWVTQNFCIHFPQFSSSSLKSRKNEILSALLVVVSKVSQK